MEAPPPPLPATTLAPGRSRKLLLLPLLLFLLRAEAVRGFEAEERPRTREEECHFYAGGQVYPGEVSRVSVAEHSRTSAKPKVGDAPPRRGDRWLPEVGRARGHVYPGYGGYPGA